MTAELPSARFREVEAEIQARGVEWQFDPTLDRIRALMDLLGEPQRGYPVIHVAGTNGKTSTARLITTLLRERGLRVGRYTSPQLRSMRERIAIDGDPVTEERFVAAYDDVIPYVRLVDDSTGRMSFFEVLTGMAYAAFADAPVDVAVVEVGLGGAWDATNVVDAQVAVVTPVSLDHTDLLGEAVEDIAAEKAGIIKPDSIVVLAQQSVAAARTLLERVAEVGATVAREGLEFGVLAREVAVGGQRLRLQGLHGAYDEVFLPLYGPHQAANAACALAAVEAFATGTPSESGPAAPSGLDPDLVRTALAAATSPGRLEVVRRGPVILVDSAHNPAGMAASVEAVGEGFGFTRLVGVVAMMADKDVLGVLAELEPILTSVVVTRNSSSRAMPVAELGELAEEIFGEERVRVAGRLDEAIDVALALAEETGEFMSSGVLITGSVVTAGDARVLLKAGD